VLIRQISRRWTRSLRQSGLVLTVRMVHPLSGSSRSTVAATLFERTTNTPAARTRHRA
jgi:hypothetical protein